MTSPDSVSVSLSYTRFTADDFAKVRPEHVYLGPTLPAGIGWGEDGHSVREAIRLPEWRLSVAFVDSPPRGLSSNDGGDWWWAGDRKVWISNTILAGLATEYRMLQSFRRALHEEKRRGSGCFHNDRLSIPSMVGADLVDIADKVGAE